LDFDSKGWEYTVTDDESKKFGNMKEADNAGMDSPTLSFHSGSRQILFLVLYYPRKILKTQIEIK